MSGRDSDRVLGMAWVLVTLGDGETRWPCPAEASAVAAETWAEWAEWEDPTEP